LPHLPCRESGRISISLLPSVPFPGRRPSEHDAVTSGKVALERFRSQSLLSRLPIETLLHIQLKPAIRIDVGIDERR
jgi:hypothetical protein